MTKKLKCCKACGRVTTSSTGICKECAGPTHSSEEDFQRAKNIDAMDNDWRNSTLAERDPIQESVDASIREQLGLDTGDE